MYEYEQKEWTKFSIVQLGIGSLFPKKKDGTIWHLSTSGATLLEKSEWGIIVFS